MHEFPSVDETDLSLIHALQINPRVTWSRLARAIDVDASTLSRRWSRLTDEGLAWLSCYPMSSEGRAGRGWAGAYVEVECLPGSRQPVMDELSRHNVVWNIDATSGRRDLLLTMISSSIVAIDEAVDSAIATVPGVRATKTHFFRKIIREGSAWRLDALSPSQQRALLPAPSRSQGALPGPQDLELLKLLGPDARIPASTVAAHLGCSAGTAGRMIERMLASGYVATRCDVAHFVAGWQVAATLWLDIPQHELTTVAAAIARMPEIRLCATIGSEANLVAQIWLHRLEDLDKFEEMVATGFPGTRVLDRWITPRFAKRLGHILRADGRRIDFVPLFPE